MVSLLLFGVFCWIFNGFLGKNERVGIIFFEMIILWFIKTSFKEPFVLF